MENVKVQEMELQKEINQYIQPLMYLIFNISKTYCMELNEFMANFEHIIRKPFSKYIDMALYQHIQVHEVLQNFNNFKVFVVCTDELQDSIESSTSLEDPTIEDVSEFEEEFITRAKQCQGSILDIRLETAKLQVELNSKCTQTDFDGPSATSTPKRGKFLSEEKIVFEFDRFSNIPKQKTKKPGFWRHLKKFAVRTFRFISRQV